VNLIPFNSVEEYELSKSSHETTEIFESILRERKIQVTTRYSKGQDIDGACGQLRRKNEN
jgi:23S rRNA (adenine2503-C2)-methyltransferase